VQCDPKGPQPSQRMSEISLALAELRDSLVKMSLVLGDMLTESESPLRDDVMIEVELHLNRLRG
jgi:hypothetical protein